MDKFSGTYTGVIPGTGRLILTRDANFINYVLKENHTNYQKSELTSQKAGKLFGQGLLFSNGEYWLRQRRMIQPGFHQKKIQDLYDVVGRFITASLLTFPTGKEIDVYPLVYRLSFNIIVQSLFDIQLSGETMTYLSRSFSELQAEQFYIYFDRKGPPPETAAYAPTGQGVAQY